MRIFSSLLKGSILVKFIFYLPSTLIFLCLNNKKEVLKYFFIQDISKDRYSKYLINGIKFWINLIYPLEIFNVSKELSKNIWQASGSIYQDLHDKSSDYWDETNPKYLGEVLLTNYMVHNKNNESIIAEIGIGNGKYLKYLKERLCKGKNEDNIKYYGFDMSNACINKAKNLLRNNTNVILKKGDAFDAFKYLKNKKNVRFVFIGVLPYLTSKELGDLFELIKKRKFTISLREHRSLIKKFKNYRGGLSWNHDYKKILSEKGIKISSDESYIINDNEVQVLST